ncbi:hypothetical protein [Methanimicrococcus hongohii]|uniref:hypothetical protein n=1 Tax=Methanimicrococcus hongohii TaxID=3028295 RepID=UPI00292E4F36|nr:hypothetical protein [Methanimicrococcus sp. Hf6]
MRADPDEPANLRLSFTVPLRVKLVLPLASAHFYRNPLALNFARLRLTKFQVAAGGWCLSAAGGCFRFRRQSDSHCCCCRQQRPPPRANRTNLKNDQKRKCIFQKNENESYIFD